MIGLLWIGAALAGGLSGTLRLEGHGRAPGATSEHPFTAAVDHQGPVFQGVWAGEDWSDAVWIEPGRVLRDEGSGWTPVEAAEGAWLAVQLLAPQPEVLLEFLRSEPARVREVPGELWWASAAGMVTVRLDDLGRPLTLELPRSHPVFGDVVDGARWIWTEGPVSTELRRAEANTRWSALVFSGDQSPPFPDPPERTALVRHAIAPGVWAIEVPEANSRVLLAIDGPRGVFFDAPLTSAIGAELLAVARELGPEVEGWSVVVSHHHPHCTGGLRPWARAGATIYAPASVAGWLEAELHEDRALDPTDPAIPKAVVVGVRGGLEHLEGAVQVRAIDGASGHTDGFLVSYLVGPKILYASDLASWKQGAEAPRVRGEWADTLKRWSPEQVVSAFPLEGTLEMWPWAGIHEPGGVRGSESE